MLSLLESGYSLQGFTARCTEIGEGLAVMARSWKSSMECEDFRGGLML